MRPEATLARSVFFLSGFAALLYQVIWQRVLVIFSGADVFSATVVVASFMAGLGAGSLVGGHLADRLGPRRSLWTFATAELCIGVFGSLSKLIYYDVLYHRFSYLAANPVLAALVLLLFFAASKRELVRGEAATLWVVGLSLVATTLWCQDSIRPVVDQGAQVIYKPWVDGFYHSVHIRIFAESHGASSIQYFRMSGVPARPYHYGMYMLPALVKQATDRAHSLGLDGRVTFHRGDLFQADLRPATVVTLYLGNELNRRLRPKLMSELRPGSRVVSHNFDMADWMPTQTIEVSSNQGTHTLYLWVVPAR